MADTIEIEKFSDAMILWFVRPEIRNPLSIEVLEQLDLIIDELNADVSTLIFTGTDGVFASGADLREIAEVDVANAKEFAIRGQTLMNRIAALPQTTIAAVNGYCFGGALDLALACDVRIASQNAEFCHPGVGLGIITGWGGTQRLPRLIGEAMAIEMFMTTKRVRAEEALRFGLIDEIADDPLHRALRNS